MKPVFLFLVAALLQVPPPGASAADRYHAGARAFVEGDDARALQEVEAGLRRAPGDARLQALRDLIQQQDQEQDNSEGDGEANEDGGQQDDAQNSDPNDDGPPGDEGQSGQDQPDRPRDDGQEAERDQTNTAPPQGQREGEPPPAAAERGEMSRAQAERILDAVGGEERLLLRELRRAPTQRRRSDKDW